MDKNKLKVLQDIKYQVNKSCALCSFGQFDNPNDDWGTCSNNLYQHEKHTDKDRYLSIHKVGSCGDFQLNDEKAGKLGAFEGLIATT